MNLDEKTIREALVKDERISLECKKEQTKNPSSVWET